MVLIQNLDGTFRVKVKEHGGRYEWNDWTYRQRQEAALKAIKRTCKECGEYNLAKPCIHHLPDRYLDRKRYALYKSEIRRGKIKEKDEAQTEFIPFKEEEEEDV